MAKKDKTKKKQANIDIVPDGMRREDYADAAFRKKVTIIMGCVLLVFLIGVSAVLISAWVETDKHNKEFEDQQQRFQDEKAEILAQLKEIDENGGTFEDRAAVKITVTDENFQDWITVLDQSYQMSDDEEGYAAFKGATIELEGLFVERVFQEGKYTEYWVYRLHKHDHNGGHDEEEAHEHSEETTEFPVGEAIPIEVILLDKDAEIPEDGAWVKVTGVVGPSSSISLSAIRNAEITVMDEHGQEYIH